MWNSASPRSPVLTSAPSLGLGPIHAAGPRAEPQAPSSGCAHLGDLAASSQNVLETSNCKIHSRPQHGHGPGRARTPPPPITWRAVGSEEPVFELGSPSPPAGSQGWPGERPRQQCREPPRPHSEEMTDLKAASDWGALFMPLPHSQGPAVTRPCPPAACPQSLRSPALLPQARAVGACSIFLRVGSVVLLQRSFSPKHPRLFVPGEGP